MSNKQIYIDCQPDNNPDELLTSGTGSFDVSSDIDLDDGDIFSQDIFNNIGFQLFAAIIIVTFFYFLGYYIFKVIPRDIVNYKTQEILNKLI